MDWAEFNEKARFYAENLFVDDNTIDEATSVAAGEKEVIGSIEADIGWEEAKDAYEPVSALRKAILDDYKAAVNTIRKKLQAAVHEGRDHPALSLRKLDPEVVVVNPELVPEAFKCPDLVKLKRVAKALGPDGFAVPGVTLKPRWGLVVKPKE
jgi:hypothetical protein